MQPPSKLLEHYCEIFGAYPDFISRAPGRINLVGAHVDFNDGLVLPAAITRNTWVAVRACPGRQVVVHSLDMQEQSTFDLSNLSAKKDVSGKDLPEWAQYAAGVADALTERGYTVPGAEMVVTGDVPIGAGMSSSAAVEVAYGLAWSHLMGAEIDPMKLAQICQRAENEYVGVKSGLMDQFASSCGVADHALLLDCRTLEWESVPLSSEVALVIADTGTRRTLATSKYHDRRQECNIAVEALRPIIPNITALRDVSPEAFYEYADLIPMPARLRAKHVVEEITRVRKAGDALKQNRIIELGSYMDDSHVSSRELYASSGPALDAMWEASLGHPARLGGRFMGAGWAGCLIFLVYAAGADDFIAYTAQRYRDIMPHNAQFYLVQAAQGAEIIPA